MSARKHQLQIDRGNLRAEILRHLQRLGLDTKASIEFLDRFFPFAGEHGEGFCPKGHPYDGTREVRAHSGRVYETRICTECERTRTRNAKRARREKQRQKMARRAAA